MDVPSYVRLLILDGNTQNYISWQIISIKSSYEVHTISFQTFFVHAFKIVVDAWKFSMLLLDI